MRKLFLLTIFFITAPCLLAVSLVFLSFLMYQKTMSSISLTQNRLTYAALPEAEQFYQTTINPQDSRVEIVRRFLTRYKSPLADYAELLVSTADTYGLEYQLLPAIAMQESGGCKKVIADSKNCFGFGIHGTQVKKFASFEEGIETVAKTLAKNYKNKGLVTIEEIGSRYNPTNTNDWIGSIHYFTNQM